VRVDSSGSGLHLRPFCSPYFAEGLQPPSYDDELLAHVVRYTNCTIASQSLW